MAEPFIGQINTNGFNFAPDKWSLCEGQILTINDHQALYSLLGTAFGGDGRTTFNLPDYRGRVTTGEGFMPGSAKEYKMGEATGSESHTLKLNELSTHAHLAIIGSGASAEVSVNATTQSGESNVPATGFYLAKSQPPGGGPDLPELIYKSNPTEDSKVSLGGFNASVGTISGNVEIGNKGSSSPFSIMQPTVAINFSIAMQGLFPSRN